LISEIDDGSGKKLTYSQPNGSDLANVTDRAGNLSTYEYDNRHDLTAIHDAAGDPPVINNYDDQGRLISTTDPAGKSIQNIYVENPGENEHRFRRNLNADSD